VKVCFSKAPIKENQSPGKTSAVISRNMRVGRRLGGPAAAKILNRNGRLQKGDVYTQKELLGDANGR